MPGGSCKIGKIEHVFSGLDLVHRSRTWGQQRITAGQGVHGLDGDLSDLSDLSDVWSVDSNTVPTA